MEPTQLPGEILCEILSHVHDVPTIKALLLTGNAKLIYYLINCLQQIGTYNPGESLPFSFVKQLVSLETLRVRVPLTSIEEVGILATLPKLKRGIITFSVQNYDEFQEVVRTFVRNYCQGTYNVTNLFDNTVTLTNNRDLLETSITIRSPLANPEGDVTAFAFLTENHSPLIVGFDADNRSVWTPSVEQIINFLTFYRQYTPLIRFDDFILSHSNLRNLDLLANYLAEVPELEQYYFTNIGTRILRTLMSRLVNKITTIVRNVKIKVPLIRIAFGLFPSSPKVRVFDVPIDIDDVPLIFQKYPRIRYITIVYNKPISPEQFLSLANSRLHHVRILTHSPESIPFNNKFILESLGSNASNV